MKVMEKIMNNDNLNQVYKKERLETPKETEGEFR